MKKIFTLLVALTTFAIGLNAEVLLKDSFNYTVGDLTSQSAVDVSVTTTEWFYTTSTAAKIQVVDTALTFPGYCTNKSAKAIQFKGNTNKAVRGVTVPSNATSIYYSVLMNVHELKNPGTTNPSKDAIIMMHNVNSSAVGNCWAQLRYLNDYTAGTYSLGISKANEAGVRWITGFPKDSTILVVVRYDIIEGTNNDKVYMWINPTKMSEGTPTSWCVQDTASSMGNPFGASTKADASNINRILLKPAAHTPNIHLDEFRMATKWADLFESGGGTEPSLSVSPAILNASYIFQGEEQSQVFSVLAENLTENISISNTNSELTLSRSVITKAAAEAGAEFTATINANKEGNQVDTITLVSGTIIKKIPVAWSAVGVANCANVKALKDSVNGQEEYTTYVRLTGEAIVTRDTVINEGLGYGSVRTLYIEDASGAAKLIDGASSIKESNLVGAKIKNIVLLNMEVVSSVQPFYVQNTPTIVSTGNEVEPQVVTLAELQAHAADYLLELIQVQKVTFADEGKTFKGDTLYKITQDEQTANVKIEMTRGFAGVTIPGKANVTGFSMNTSGSAILPRSTDDIVDANPVLLKNGSFEKYEEKSFLGTPGAEFEDWTVTRGVVAVSVEKTDVLEGEAALRTTTSMSGACYIDQPIDCSNYAAGDQFKLRICYKNITTGDENLKLESYWTPVGGKEITEIDPQLTQTLPYSSVWDTVEIITTKPENGYSFYLRFKVAKNAVLLLDNLAFDEYISDDPYFSVMPEKPSYSFTTTINNDTAVATLTIRQRNLTQPVKLAMTGTGKAAYSIDKTQVTEAEETVTVKFKATAVGNYNATLNITDDESPVTSLMNTTINFYGTAIDPTREPVITITPMEFDTFRCKAYETVTDTFVVKSENCYSDVHVVTDDETGAHWAFGLSDSYFVKNSIDTVVITFAPKRAGNYTAKFKAYTSGIADTIRFSVAGVAEEGQPEPTVVDWDTVFNWDMTNPYATLNEGFDHADTCKNKTLKTTDWQNVVLQGGDRPWWGFFSDTTKQAKITSYYYQTDSGSVNVESWLVTPALDYQNAPSQYFTFKVMSDLIYQGQTGKLEVYYIDASNPSDIWFQHIVELDSLIPANDSELEGNWVSVVLPLVGQTNIPDVFFMAFKFTDKGGNNGVTYYVDDVTWGLYVPSGIKEVQNAQCTMQNVHKFVNNGQLIIVKDGKRYNALGQRVR